jgi:hypothetical protein
MTVRLRHLGFPRAGFVLAALVLGGCALIGATGATAATAFSTTTPFNFSGTNPCTGDVFAGTGKLHLLISDNLSDSGNVQFHIEATFSGLQAVTTLPSVPGKKYVVVSQENFTTTFDLPDGAPSHETVEHTVQFIRSGEDGTLFPDDDFFEHFLTHITANANGVITVQDVETDSRCR